MRALVLDDGVKLLYEYPTPDISELPVGEALVRVYQAGICSTDLELIQGYSEFRGVLGHEFVGVVEACPFNPNWVERRVVGEINISCGVCATCQANRPKHCLSRTALGIRGRDGAFADFLTLPIENLHAVPDSVSDDQAVFVEPLAAALAITDQVHVGPNDRVVVLGDGKLGLLIAQVLALTGCALTAIGHHQEKLDLLAVRGIDTYLIDPSYTRPDISADVVIEATGTPKGFTTALSWVRPQGKLVLKSTYHNLASVDLSKIVVDEVQIIGSRCGPFTSALRLLEKRLVDVEPLIQARFSLDEGILALKRAAQKGTLKVLIKMRKP